MKSLLQKFKLISYSTSCSISGSGTSNSLGSQAILVCIVQFQNKSLWFLLVCTPKGSMKYDPMFEIVRFISAFTANCLWHRQWPIKQKALQNTHRFFLCDLQLYNLYPHSSSRKISILRRKMLIPIAAVASTPIAFGNSWQMSLVSVLYALRWLFEISRLPLALVLQAELTFNEVQYFHTEKM